MIPVLYESDEREFGYDSLGYLKDCISCTVTEERNGVFECEFSYPVTGPLFKEILDNRIIYATHDDKDDGQPFDIYGRSEPIDGVVTFYAHHISYRLGKETVTPYRASSAASALDQLPKHIVNGDGFEFSSENYQSGEFAVTVPTGARNILGGSEESVLEIFGGEYEFDKFKVILHEQRGKDTDIAIRYGKNLKDYTHETDWTDTYNAVVPYWYQEPEEGETTGTLVMLPERYIAVDEPTPRIMAVPLDLSGEFDEKPSESKLRALARKEFKKSKAWQASEDYTINFMALWQTEEYKEFAPLQKCNLCDTVLIYYPIYGVNGIREKIVKTVYNTLLDRYDEITLNRLPATFSGTIS